MPQPELMQGSVDALNRPFVKWNLPGFPGPVTAFIDTGFNGSMIVAECQSERIGLGLARNQFIEATLASLRPQIFSLCTGSIDWMGSKVFVSALVVV